MAQQGFDDVNELVSAARVSPGSDEFGGMSDAKISAMEFFAALWDVMNEFPKLAEMRCIRARTIRERLDPSVDRSVTIPKVHTATRSDVDRGRKLRFKGATLTFKGLEGGSNLGVPEVFDFFHRRREHAQILTRMQAINNTRAGFHAQV